MKQDKDFTINQRRAIKCCKSVAILFAIAAYLGFAGLVVCGLVWAWMQAFGKELSWMNYVIVLAWLFTIIICLFISMMIRFVLEYDGLIDLEERLARAAEKAAPEATSPTLD